MRSDSADSTRTRSLFSMKLRDLTRTRSHRQEKLFSRMAACTVSTTMCCSSKRLTADPLAIANPAQFTLEDSANLARHPNLQKTHSTVQESGKHRQSSVRGPSCRSFCDYWRPPSRPRRTFGSKCAGVANLSCTLPPQTRLHCADIRRHKVGQ